MNYEDLLAEADEAGLTVKEKPLHAHDGRISGKNIAIRQDIPTFVQKACVLAEELGHYHTASGDILNQSSDANRKQEHRGRRWAYDRQIGLSGIIQGYRRHCQSRQEFAEYLDVSEEFLQEALDCYRNKYGIMTELDSCIIMFEPVLTVIEKVF